MEKLALGTRAGGGGARREAIRDKERLQTSLERFFRRLAVDKPVIRNNYFIQVNRPEDKSEDGEKVDPEEIGWAQSTLGAEDAFVHGGHKLDKPKTETEKKLRAEVEWIRLRSERQTLRRLPHSGAVVFTIRTYLTPVVALGEEKGVPGRMASALRSWPADVGEYKGQERGGWFKPVVEYLDACHAGQEVGLDESEMDEKTREKGYPL